MLIEKDLQYDTILVADSVEQCRAGVTRKRELFMELGFLINMEKSVLEPTQQLAFLGYIFDSKQITICLGEEKMKTMQEACYRLLNKDKASIRDVARVVGLMVAYSEGADLELLHYRRLEHDKMVALQDNFGDFDKFMTIS